MSPKPAPRSALTAALLSALVFPGAGQIYLKRTIRGLAFALPAALGLLLVVQNIYSIAMRVVDQVQDSALAPDPQAIMDAVSAATAAGDSWLSNLAGYLFLACWLLSIWDAYKIGKKS